MNTQLPDRKPYYIYQIRYVYYLPGKQKMGDPHGHPTFQSECFRIESRLITEFDNLYRMTDFCSLLTRLGL